MHSFITNTCRGGSGIGKVEAVVITSNVEAVVLVLVDLTGLGQPVLLYLLALWKDAIVIVMLLLLRY